MLGKVVVARLGWIRLRDTLLLRWPALYLLTYMLNPPMGDWVVKVVWAFFRIEVGQPVFPGRADTAFNYGLLLLQLLLALAGAFVWSALAPDWDPQSKGLRAVRTLARYWVGWTFLIYGAMKLAPLQFPAPDLDRLLQPVGQCSPMGLLWTFMGSSPVYGSLAGGLEVLAALLLLWRRTATLGALLGLAVMAQVLALNLCYDLPLKLFSLHLALLSLWIAGPDFGRLVRASLGLSNAPRPDTEFEVYRAPVRLLKAIVILFLLGSTAQGIWEFSRLREEYQSPEALRGSWRLAGGAAPSGQAWQRLIVPLSSGFAIQDEWGRTTRYSALFPAQPGKAGLVRLTDWTHPEFTARLRYRLDGDRLRLTGQWEDQRVDLQLTREPLPSFLLTTRGFHWVNEAPFNR